VVPASLAGGRFPPVHTCGGTRTCFSGFHPIDRFACSFVPARRLQNTQGDTRMPYILHSLLRNPPQFLVKRTERARLWYLTRVR